MLRAALALLALVSTPTAAQQAEPAPSPARDVRVVPMQEPRHPQPVRFLRVKSVEISQAAKDEGHIGSATYVATVDADGQLIALTLQQSSMSPAIDAAVEEKARGLRYLPATDKGGNKVEGKVDVFIGYSRYDSESLGGGIETYTCGDLIREYDWFTAANAGRGKLFWPQNAYTSLTMLDRILASERPKPQERLAARTTREKMWAKLIKRCRKATEKLMLTVVDQPEAYLRLINSY